MTMLASENFEGILGAREDARIEFKQQIDLNLAKDKHKLVKAVAALANNRGGLVLIGVARERDPASRADYAGKLTYSGPIETSTFYRIISELLYPVPRVTVDHFGKPPSQLIAINIERADADYPILVTQSMSESLNGGSIFGYYKRTEEESGHIRHADIHALIQAGERWRAVGDLHEAMVQMAKEIKTISAKLSTLLKEENR